MIKHLYDSFAERYYRGGSIYVYSDPHFGDFDCYKRRCAAIVKKYNKSGDFKALSEVERELFNVYNMYLGFVIAKEEEFVEACDMIQVKAINKVAHKCDTLIVLGDVGDTKYVSMLKAGYKVLVMGNHDKGASNYKRLITKVDAGVEFGCIADDSIPMSFKAQKSIDNRLFDEVYEGNLYISDKIKLSHAPAPEAGYINLHGHDHAHNDGYCFAAEHIGYTPVCLKTIFESGALGKTTSFRRTTVDRAIERKKKREGK